MSRRRRQERKELDKGKIEAARAALQHMDDCAMMGTAIDPVGPRSVLEQFIAEVERLAGTDAAYMDRVPVAGDDLLDRLQRAIDEAVTKPGKWVEGIAAGGEIATPWSEQLMPTTIGNMAARRDAWLAIAAVNALPELMERARRAEAELKRLHAATPHATPCCGDPGDCGRPCEAERKPSAKKSPCPDCGACWTGPHACGKPGFHGEPAPADEGWIKWDGGECPVEPEALVKCRYREGHVTDWHHAEVFRWNHATPTKPGLSQSHDIVAYRLRSPA